LWWLIDCWVGKAVLTSPEKDLARLLQRLEMEDDRDGVYEVDGVSPADGGPESWWFIVAESMGL
jgi:hypothetical protein